MKLAEALSILHKAPSNQPPFSVLLACGFTPLHLGNYLAAHLQKALPDRYVKLGTGLYDDVSGTLEQFDPANIHSAALVIEWSDLDPRLGYRNLGGWGRRVLPGILERVEATLARLETAINAIPPSSKLAVSLPTLPLPPGFHTTSWQSSDAELRLEEQIAGFASRIARHASVLLVNRARLDALSAPETRYDLRADLHAGFPYTMSHASTLGAALANLLQPVAPKKGIISDLDDTLWFGLVGEVGHENVSWDLASHSQLHGLYQQMLHSLADQGALIGIASKNSPEAVEQALSRSDLVIARDKMFPIEVHWEPKSGSVARILKTWNISADSVVFVDDSPMELEEVRAAHPGIECLLFPKSDYVAGLQFLNRLRDLFGKPRLSEEDDYRLDSIRQAHDFTSQNGSSGLAEKFLAGAEAIMTIEFNPPPTDARVVELVNKTNQFNLNGVRFSEAEWQECLREPGSFALVVGYRDKFGPLGKIAVMRGEQQGTSLHVGTWVMSCRAFSRRIEHQCLAQLFDKFGVDEIQFDFKPTPKNGPLSDFLSGLLDEPPLPPVRLKRETFTAKRPELYHKVLTING